MTLEDQLLYSEFEGAIAAKNLAYAHNLVTLMDVSPEGIARRRGAYKIILVTALELGRRDTALIVAPFCGHIF